MYEYCVMRCDFPDDPHRVPPLNEDGKVWCEQWVAEWYEICPESAPGLFYVARREATPWERA